MFKQSDKIQVKFEDGSSEECKHGTLVGELLSGDKSQEGFHYLGALVNNDVVSLSYPLEVDSTVRFLTIADPYGWRIYRRSVSFLLAKTVKEVFPEAKLYIEHSLGTGFYCNFEMNGQTGITDGQIKAIDTRMREIVEENLSIDRRHFFFEDALKHFEDEKQPDKRNLLRFRNPPKVTVYVCEGFVDLAHGVLANSTAALDAFKLISYEPGFVIQFPEKQNPAQISPFEKQPHLFQIFKDYKEWGKILGVRTVGDINEIIAQGEFSEFVKIEEALHEKKICEIADHIKKHSDRIKWIMIAGPSSSGKTTFAKRTAVQCRVNGLRPVTISVDNYFVDRTKTPIDEHGELDFENIETIDLELFNEHLKLLDEGKEIELPFFNFEKGEREYRGEMMKIEDDQLVVVEGIHGLNPRLSEAIPAERKFKIYISALTQLNLDDNNRISTTDNRLVRRMVRDYAYRGNSALVTLGMWPSVRRGEKKWIFPFQSEADTAFNSGLDYELAVLKSRVEPLLAEIKPYQKEYADARRLQQFLEHFLNAPTSPVPPTSLLREFIGQSGFSY